jgi:hypothetical protein
MEILYTMGKGSHLNTTEQYYTYDEITDRQCMYNVTLRSVCATIAAVEKQ